MSQLFADCLNEIFEYLENDMVTLHSCLLVNRLWCVVSVRILWRDTRNYNALNFRTLIDCLPTESKEILSMNGINIISKSPMFNYTLFCKVLSINKVNRMIKKLSKNQQPSSWTYERIVRDEICKMFMNQNSSLKGLIFFESLNLSMEPRDYCLEKLKNLKNLSELHCNSRNSPEFFFRLSKTCQNISILEIAVDRIISNGLTDLISFQKNLKCFIIKQYDKPKDTSSLSLLLEKLPNTLSKLNLSRHNYVSLSFIANFTNLKELELSFDYFEDFEKLQYAIFPKLQS